MSMPSAKDIVGAFDHTKKIDWVGAFLNFDIRAYERLLEREPEAFWQREGERRALKLFHQMAVRVPAYKDFLKKQKIRPASVRTIADFKKLPSIDKKNYITRYPLAERCWDGNAAGPTLAAVSSGTTGEPAFWPRGGYQDFEAGVIHEAIYRSIFEIDKYKTLLIIGFPMGVYVSGVATLVPSLLIAGKKYNLTVVSPGNNKAEVLRAVRHLAGDFDQIILAGHPFFLKDIIESGRAAGIHWSQKRLRLMFCSEGFNETWRRFVVTETGNQFHFANTVSTYGSSELLLMAHETPLTILVRNLMDKHTTFRAQLTPTMWVPNLFQYNPMMRYIESDGSDLMFTSASGLPLVKYNLHDGGRVVPFGEVLASLNLIQPEWRRAFKKDNPHNTIWQLPFVMLGGRTDQTMVFYAANIYPEHIHLALNYGPFLKKLTGKFVMHKHYLKNMDEYLEINVELKQSIKPDLRLAKLIQSHVTQRLKEINMEYLFISTHNDKDLRPHIKLREYQDAQYFKPGLKPRYIHSVAQK